MNKALLALILALCTTASAQRAEPDTRLPDPGEPGAILDPRYCGEPERDKYGIKRSKTVLRQFVAVFPCPATLVHTTSCPGWAIDHTIPLSMGGCDSIANLTWLPDSIKSCADDDCKDRWERKYHALPRKPVQLIAR